MCKIKQNVMAKARNNAIKKKQLVGELADITGITVIQCDYMFDVLIEVVKHHLLSEEEVELKLLGRFYYYQHGPKQSNMTKGTVPAHKQLRFKVAEGVARNIRVRTREQ
jgi:nucleoid DNA-binding protein